MLHYMHLWCARRVVQEAPDSLPSCSSLEILYVCRSPAIAFSEAGTKVTPTNKQINTRRMFRARRRYPHRLHRCHYLRRTVSDSYTTEQAKLGQENNRQNGAPRRCTHRPFPTELRIMACPNALPSADEYENGSGGMWERSRTGSCGGLLNDLQRSSFSVNLPH